MGREGQWPAAGHVERGHGSVQHKQLNKISLNCLFICFGSLSYMAEHLRYSLRYKVITMVNYLLSV